MSMASKLGSLAQQLAEVTAELEATPDQIQDFPPERDALAKEATKILNATQSPAVYFENMMAHVAQYAALRLFVEWGVFDHIPTHGAISIGELASKVNVDPELITRFSRILVVQGALRQDEARRLSHTPISTMFLSDNPITSFVRTGYDDHLKSLSSIVSYFQKYGAKEPSGRFGTVFAYSNGDPDITVWEHMNRNPDRMRNFMVSMVAMGKRMTVTGSYDFTWLLNPKHGDSTLVVDIGGGRGHALEAILLATPELAMDRCVVQDLDPVVQEAKKLAEGPLIQAQFVASDFHQEQPTKGALLYYIRRCLHDYGDKDCVEILQHIQRAMAEDSRLLIVEQILPSQPSAGASATDIFMMTLGGKERTLEGFRSITSDAGLEIVKVHGPEGSDLALIECKKI